MNLVPYQLECKIQYNREIIQNHIQCRLSDAGNVQKMLMFYLLLLLCIGIIVFLYYFYALLFCAGMG